MRSSEISITRSLTEQIFVQPIHWCKTTDFPDSITHVVDFGPGGTSGIGPLTARTLDGRGMRVVMFGNRTKDGAEFFDSQNVIREQRWSTKWSPRLIKTRQVFRKSSIYCELNFCFQ